MKFLLFFLLLSNLFCSCMEISENNSDNQNFAAFLLELENRILDSKLIANADEKYDSPLPMFNIDTQENNDTNSCTLALAKKACKYKTCNFCSKTIVSRYMIRHIRTHTGERLFQCSKCLEKFQESGQTSRHIRMKHHPYNVTASVLNLLTNKASHVERTEFICDYCNKTFYQASLYYAHTKRHEFKASCICKKRKP